MVVGPVLSANVGVNSVWREDFPLVHAGGRYAKFFLEGGGEMGDVEIAVFGCYICDGLAGLEGFFGALHIAFLVVTEEGFAEGGFERLLEGGFVGAELLGEADDGELFAAFVGVDVFLGLQGDLGMRFGEFVGRDGLL